jgi:hypothetical protein
MSGSAPSRRTVDLVVVVLGMKVIELRGLRTLARTGRRIRESVDDAPDGLLHNEFALRGLVPPHVEMRQYWRDFDALEAFARSSPHSDWWPEFQADHGGTAFWHETYAPDGIEAVYAGLDDDEVGLMHVAPVVPAEGGMFSSRQRLAADGDAVADHPTEGSRDV